MNFNCFGTKSIKRKNPWLALISWSKKGHKAKSSTLNGGDISQLPDDILWFIMSFLTMKEAARTSLVSPAWRELWGYFPKLNFEAPNMLEDKLEKENKKYYRETIDYYELVAEERSKFVRWVDLVLKNHLGTSIDEFRVVFDLDVGFQTHIDEWVELTLAKHVKRLEFGMEPVCRTRRHSLESKRICFPVQCCMPNLSNGWKSFNCSLLSLHLSYVKISAENVGCILRFFTHLEELFIESAASLPYITVSDVSLKLKKLEVLHCRSLNTIDISSPNLFSFRYWGGPIKLNIRNAFLLSELSIAGCPIFLMSDAFDSLSNYLPQLKYLQLTMSLRKNMEISYSPTLKNLKHLELTYFSLSRGRSLLGWIPLIEASPILEKLTIEIDSHINNVPFVMDMVKCDGQRLKSLKVLEFVDFVGRPIELELATYVLRNAVNLEKVIIVSIHRDIYQESNLESRERIIGLQSNLPEGVKLIVN